jgi:ABC-type transport system substrate-binding protein
MKGTWKILTLVLAFLFVLGACTPTTPAETSASASASQSESVAAETEEETGEVLELPRNETLYIGGLQWGRIVGWNPYSGDMNNAIAVTENPARQPVWETLYMYNLLDGKMYPLLADGDYQWSDDGTSMIVKIKAAAKWISKNYDVKTNPMMGDNGLYYYYHTFAKALDAMKVDQIETPDGVKHDWRRELREEILRRQKPDGSWVNDNKRWLESEPALVTGYALLALSYCKPTAEAGK